MYILAIGLLEKITLLMSLTVAGAVGNIIPVLLGNVIGGGVFVALVYSTIFKSEILAEVVKHK